MDGNGKRTWEPDPDEDDEGLKEGGGGQRIRWTEVPPEERRHATQNAGWSGQGSRLFGTPDVPAAKPFFCQRCQQYVLPQDVEWRLGNKPHCPDCGAVL